MMIFWDIPEWMLVITWLVGVNVAIVVIAHLWLWFATKINNIRSK
jgi:hypothetical protein